MTLTNNAENYRWEQLRGLQTTEQLSSNVDRGINTYDIPLSYSSRQHKMIRKTLERLAIRCGLQHRSNIDKECVNDMWTNAKRMKRLVENNADQRRSKHCQQLAEATTNEAESEKKWELATKLKNCSVSTTNAPNGTTAFRLKNDQINKRKTTQQWTDDGHRTNTRRQKTLYKKRRH